MKKAVFLGLMLAFLVGSGLAKADVFFNDTFENGIGTWNDTYDWGPGKILEGSGISPITYVSPSNSLRLIGGYDGGQYAIMNITYFTDSFDYWINIALNTSFNESTYNDFLAVVNMGDTVSIYADPDYGNNWTLSHWNGNKMYGNITAVPYSWTNITIHSYKVMYDDSADNSIELFIDGVPAAELKNETYTFNNVYTNETFLILWPALQESFFDNVCIHNESLGYDCFYVPPCVQNWTCTEWGECVRGYQTRICTDENECGNKTGEPAEIQLCLTPVPNATMNITQACCPISTLRCFDNSTLVEIWNTSAGVAYAFEDCPFGCDNSTLSCAPKKFEQNLYLLGIFIFIVVAGLIAIKWAKR